MKRESLASFDVLRYLAENNPEAFEKYRQRAIDNLIDSAPAEFQRRLRGLQFQIDATRRASGTPLAACLKISRMMHDSAARLRGALDGLVTGRESIEAAGPADAATVVQFPQ